MVFQLGLVEREIQEILSGHLKFQNPKRQSEESSVPQSASCDQRAITGDDLCPICQESLTTKPQRLSYCKYIGLHAQQFANKINVLAEC